METKDYVALLLLTAALFGGITVTSVSRRARDAAFFAMIALAVVADRLDVNFFSRYWYRGSTRGVEISFVDIIAMSVFVSSFLFPARGHSRWRWPAGLGMVLLFLFYAFGATLISEPKLFGFFELSKMVRGVIFFLAAAFFVRSERELQIMVLGLCCAACLEGLFVVKQRFLGGMDRVAGTLDHANSLSMYLCLIAPIFVAAINSPLSRFLRWFSAVALASAALAVVLTVSRAGVPIFAFVVIVATLLCMTWRFTIKKVVTVLVVVVGMTVVGFKFWNDLEKRYTESSLSEEYLQEGVIDSRGYYLRLAKLIVAERFFGVGLNNWSHAVSKTYGQQLNTPYADYDNIPPDLDYNEEINMNFAAPAHNLCALTIGELGVPGLLLFLLLWLRWFQMGAMFLFRRRRTLVHLLAIGLLCGVTGVFLQSLTEWVYRQTPIYLTFHALMGVLASIYALRRKAHPYPARQAQPVSAQFEMAGLPAK